MTHLLMLGGLGGLTWLFAQSADIEAAREAIRRADLEFCRALVDKNVERFKSFIAEDATFYGGTSPARGRETVFQGWAHYFSADAQRKVTWEPQQVEVSRSGDLGYTQGEAVFTRIEAEGKPVTARSHYVTIWRKHPDGSWKAVVDIGTPPQSQPSQP